MSEAIPNTDTAEDAEFAAMQTVYAALRGLDEDARDRVLTYVTHRLGISTSARRQADGNGDAGEEIEDTQGLKREEAQAPKYTAFGELFSAANPKTQPDKALVAAYWLQVCQGVEAFDSFSANRELKQLGEGLDNITGALTALKDQRPSLVIQLKKSGQTRQARKTYKVTVPGIQAVEKMLNG
jgi:hypothetical protein